MKGKIRGIYSDTLLENDETGEIMTPTLGRAQLEVAELPSSIGILAEVNSLVGQPDLVPSLIACWAQLGMLAFHCQVD